MTLDNQTCYPKNKCKWCGKPFTKRHNRQEYCCDDCAHYALLEQKAEFARKYRKRYKKEKSDSYCGIGSGGLGGHRKDSFEEEGEAIAKELRRLKLK